MKNLLPFGGEMFLFDNFFTPAESDSYFKILVEEITWKHEPIKIFGKSAMQARLTAWYGDEGKPYTYSGVTMAPSLWSDTLLQIKSKVEKVLACKFNSALLNLYRDGNDSVGWHRYNEKGMGATPTIASLSFGASRNFQIRTYKEKANLETFSLHSGCLLIMKGEMQNIWSHQVPKTIKHKEARINITFRYIV